MAEASSPKDSLIAHHGITLQSLSNPANPAPWMVIPRSHPADTGESAMAWVRCSVVITVRPPWRRKQRECLTGKSL